MRQLILLPAVAPILVAVSAYGTCLWAVYAHLVPAARDCGLADADGARAVSVAGLCGAAGRVVVGAYADARGVSRTRLLVACLVAGGLAVLALGAATPRVCAERAGGPGAPAALFFAVAAGFGFFSGAVVAQVPPLLADEVGVENLPLAAGLNYLVQAPFVLLAPPLAGALRDARGTYTVVWCVVGVAMSVSPLILLRLKSAYT